MNKIEKSSRLLTLRDFVSLPFKFYNLVGIQLFKWDENDLMTTRDKFLMVFTVINLCMNFIFKCAYFLFEEFESTVQFTQWFLYLSFASNGFFKMCSVVLGRKTLHRVLKDLEPLFPRTAKERRDFQLVEGYAYIIRLSKVMSISHCAIALMFIIFPIVQSSVEFLLSEDENAVFIKRTPYVLTYPFDDTTGFGYGFAYSTQFLAGCTISCYFVAADMLLLCTIYVVNLQFDYLCFRIRNFKPISFENDMQELKIILEKHHILNDLAQRVNNVFSLSILLNYMISILVIVLIGIQIVTGSNLLDFVKFIGFFMASTMQVYYVCKFGTQLMENSGQVSEAFIGQVWYMTDVRYQRMLILAIARSQRPAHLTAFKFFIISMESFSNLMTTSYQFFTLLNSRMAEEEL